MVNKKYIKNITIIKELTELYKKSKAQNKEQFLKWLIEHSYPLNMVDTAQENFDYILKYIKFMHKNKLTNIRRFILLISSFILILIFLFPPFIGYYPNHTLKFIGYYFIFTLPKGPTTVCTQLLIIEIIVIAILTFMIYKFFDR